MTPMPLMKRFYADRFLHIRSFSLHFLVSLGLCIALYNLRSPEFFTFHLAWWHLALVPLGIYLGGVSAVWMHNASHGSFKNPVINDIAGHFAGLHQLWGFTGWKLIHLVHHHYSDTPGMDPHAPEGRSFWEFARIMFVHSSRMMTRRYQEHWGNSPATRLLQKAVVAVFLAMTLLNLTFWYLLLGPAVFLCLYIPSYISNHLLYVDINYTAHPKDPVTGETAAANLDHNLYFKLANLCWSGIYYHANHHRKPWLYNPKYMPVSQRRQKPEKPQELAA